MFHGTDQPEAIGAEKGLEGHPEFGLKGQNFPNFLVIDPGSLLLWTVFICSAPHSPKLTSEGLYSGYFGVAHLPSQCGKPRP